MEKVSKLSDSIREELETVINDLYKQKSAWASKSISDRIEILNQIKKNFLSISDAWVRISQKNKGINEKDPATNEEWSSGPFAIVRYIRLLHDSLYDIKTIGYNLLSKFFLKRFMKNFFGE